MILKHADDRSADLAVLAGLLREAASPRQRARVRDEIDNIVTGQRGEREVAYFLNHHYRDADRSLVIHDLRIAVDGEVAQIDHLVINRFLRTAIVIESKSYRAKLQCNAVGEWTAWYGRKAVPIASPVQQAKRHVTTLQRWLKAQGITDIVEFWPLVLIGANMQADVAAATDVPVVRADLIEGWWDRHVDQKVGALKAVARLMTKLSHDELMALGHRIVAGHQSAVYDWRGKLGFPSVAATSVAVAAPGRPEAAPEEVANGTSDHIAIASPCGPVTAIRLPDGSYALRHGRDGAVVEHVKSIAKGRGYWNGRYRNWIIPSARFLEVQNLLQANQPAPTPPQ